MVQAFHPILGCLVLHAYDNLHMCWVMGLLLVLVYHTLSCHQDTMLGEQSPAAGKVPECGLLCGPLLVRHRHYMRPVGAGSIRR